MWSSRFLWKLLIAFGTWPLLSFVAAAAILTFVSLDHRAHVLTMAVIAGCGLGTICMCYWLAQRVMRLRQQLLAASQAMAKDDFSCRVEMQSNDELGHIAAIINALREDLRQRVAKIQDNRDRMAAVLAGMVEGVLAVDPNQRVLLANDASRELLDISTREVVGRPLLEIVRNLDVRQAVLDALAGQPSSSREVAITAVTRRMLHVLATRLPGEPCPGVVVVLHDVTELRRLENLRRDFVANVSHELKTPLSAITAYAETLRLGAIHDPQNNLGFVERIEEQATRLHQLILDLLHLARVETGKEAFEFCAVSLNETAETSVAQHRDVATTNGLTLSLESVPSELLVWADHDGVLMILDNLVANAIKFTPRGGHVTIRCRGVDNFAEIEVADTGIGISQQDQQRVFERFYRADRARSRELGGTGLGLAIVKHLAQAFGGEVGLTSEVGRGSSFRVRLPKTNAAD